jgi:hypothetical protein
MSGSSGAIRTHNIHLMGVMLYPIELRSQMLSTSDVCDVVMFWR